MKKLILIIVMVFFISNINMIAAEKLIYETTANFLSINEQKEGHDLLSALQKDSNIVVKWLYINKEKDITGTIEENFGNEKRKLILIVRTEESIDIYTSNLPLQMNEILKKNVSTWGTSDSYIGEIRNFSDFFKKNKEIIKEIATKKESLDMKLFFKQDLKNYIKLAGIISLLVAAISFFIYTLRRILKK